MLSVMDDIDKADEERRGVKRKVSLSRCDVCETQESKYRCPNCMKHTCSLACVKRHKTSSGCSGVRDKTAFVSLSQFDEMSLLSDYRFLEDTARLRERSNRDGVLHGNRRHPKEGSWLIRRARAAKVTLKFLPKMFSKNRENTTIFKKAEKRLHWHLKIHFPQSGAVYSERFPDNRELCQILNEYIHPSASDPVRRQKLKVYVHSPQEDIKVFMKSEQIKPNSPRFLELDTQKTLGENLMYQTVVEYPEIFVVLKQHSQEYLTRTKERLSSAAAGNLSRPSDETLSKTSAHVEKKTKVISDADELEDGEIRSEEDGSDDDDDITDKTAPESHQEAGGHDDDDDDEERLKVVLTV
nr:box C/D snoRNA protein 1 [Misgurnus anguillicaudatus]